MHDRRFRCLGAAAAIVISACGGGHSKQSSAVMFDASVRGDEGRGSFVDAGDVSLDAATPPVERDGGAPSAGLCPDDVAKTSPGVCGCSVADTDADGDDRPGCIDCDDANPAVWQELLGHPDADTDGHTGAAAVPVCTDGSLPPGFLAAPSTRVDCDDTQPAVVRCTGALAWAIQAGGGGAHDAGHDVAVLADGSVLVTGVIAGSATFGAGEAQQTTFANPQLNEWLFVARYDAGGTLAWARRAGGSGSTLGNAIAALADGSSLVTGSFTGSVTFGAGEVNERTLVSSGFGTSSDIFVARFDASGRLTWVARAEGGGTRDAAYAIAALADGSALITGNFVGTATFGPGEARETVLTVAGSDSYADIFVARFDPDGALRWATRAGGEHADFGHGIAVLADGSALVTGNFRRTATFGLGESNQTALTNPASTTASDVFVARYADDGSLVWATREGSTDVDESAYTIAALADGSSLVVGDFLARYDASGDLVWKKYGGSNSDVAALADGSSIVTGIFWSTTTLGRDEAHETALTGEGGEDTADILVARYASDGALVWAKRAGGSGDDYGQGVAVLADGTSFLTGFFANAATFGAAEAGETTLSAGTGQDIFVARYDAAGTLVWAKRAGAAADEAVSSYGTGIAALPDGSSFVTGHFSGELIFGEGEPDETRLEAPYGEPASFIARYDGNGSLVWAKRIGGGLVGRSIAVFADGGSIVTGALEGSATLGANEPNETVLDSASGADLFIARYDAAGSLDWAQQAGGVQTYPQPSFPGATVAARAHGSGVSVLADGSVVVTGQLYGSVTFGAAQARETSLTSAGGPYGGDVFVARYDRDGTLAWVRRAGGTGDDGGAGVAALSNGGVLVTGTFAQTATFGPDDDMETALISSGAADALDVFVARYNPDGTLAWAQRAGGEANDLSRGIAALPDGAALVTGDFNGVATFGNEQLGSAGRLDIFLARFAP